MCYFFHFLRFWVKSWRFQVFSWYTSLSVRNQPIFIYPYDWISIIYSTWDVKLWNLLLFLWNLLQKCGRKSLKYLPLLTDFSPSPLFYAPKFMYWLSELSVNTLRQKVLIWWGSVMKRVWLFFCPCLSFTTSSFKSVSCDITVNPH